MSIRTLLAALIIPAAAASARADDVFATFANHGTVVFKRTLTGFTGAGTIDTFVLGSTVYGKAKFTMTPLTILGSPGIAAACELSGGSFTISTPDGTSLLQATFASARLASNGAWNTAFNASNPEGDRLLYGSYPVSDPSRNGFSFAMSPVIGVPNSYDASFSAVGVIQPVPEPASLAALGLGATALIRRRRTRFRR